MEGTGDWFSQSVAFLPLECRSLLAVQIGSLEARDQRLSINPSPFSTQFTVWLGAESGALLLEPTQ